MQVFLKMQPPELLQQSDVQPLWSLSPGSLNLHQGLRARGLTHPELLRAAHGFHVACLPLEDTLGEHVPLRKMQPHLRWRTAFLSAGKLRQVSGGWVGKKHLI